MFFFVTVAFSQNRLKNADRLFDAFAYQEASEIYNGYLEREKKPEQQILIKAADANYYTAQYENALKWYGRLHAVSGSRMPEKQFARYIQCLRMAENYNKADKLLFERLKRQKSFEAMEKLSFQRKQLEEINAQPSLYDVFNIDANTDKADFGVAFYGNKVVYSSSKNSQVNKKEYSWNRQPFLELYIADIDTATGAFTNDRPFFKKEETGYHNAVLTFTPDLKIVYYSANRVNKKDKLQNDPEGTNNLLIIKARVANDQFYNPRVLDISSTDYSVAHPALSTDGKWLFFASDKPGGFGETDIYAAAVLKDGTLGAPQNLGDVINTSGREMFPYVMGDTLYFSSDAHYGMGGLDVFNSSFTDDLVFSEPENLGKSINSSYDDFAYVVYPSMQYGYFSSNRKEGKGDDDIYFFKKKKQEKSSTEESDEVGTENPDYIGLEYEELVRKEDNVEKIDINPVFFDFDKYDITERAVKELDKVVYVLKRFSEMVIRIESHTDCRGNDDYNMLLSQNRAKATYDYILSKGISQERIQSVAGYGEARLRNHCSNGVDCSEEEHQLNRRSDFIIVSR